MHCLGVRGKKLQNSHILDNKIIKKLYVVRLIDILSSFYKKIVTIKKKFFSLISAHQKKNKYEEIPLLKTKIDNEGKSTETLHLDGGKYNISNFNPL